MKNVFILLILSFFILPSHAKDSEELFEVFNIRNEEDGSTVVYATNNYMCDESVLIEFNTLKNMEADVKLPFRTVVPAGSKKYKLFTLTIKNRSKGSQLGYTTRFCHGNAFEGEHDDKHVYTIPYKEGEQYGIGQAYGGRFSHYMKGKTHAIDFTMPEGTSICAARDGIVIFVKDDSNKHGKTIKYQSYGNYITIYHSDGTMANYFHLKKNGSKVKVGDKVKAGEVIALSGNTGWSSGPHLHFQVFRFDENMEVKSVATKFRQVEGKAIILKKSKEGYLSVH
ncbi:MAG: M23 family metallopeptidase [Flavobacteriales bacterium]|nr:M23 family metallopeptidase [Flavobacteriales bacterium]